TAGAVKAYQTHDDPTMNSMHFHWVKLTAADFTNLKAGKEVRKPSCNGDHEHEFIINCTGTEGQPNPQVAAYCGVTPDPHRTCGERATPPGPDTPYPMN